MEMALHPDIPTYSGGLGVLAGDTLRSCADLEVPIVGVTLLYRQGHFRQKLDPVRGQIEEPEIWPIERFLVPETPRVVVELEGRPVLIRAWRFDLRGASGYSVPVFLLDTDLPENTEKDRALTDRLYGGDSAYRLAQEAVLGIGGMRILRALGYESIETLHLNEGHASLAAVELLRASHRENGWEVQPVRERCVFTTHTPVPAGHDQFEWPLVDRLLGELLPRNLFQQLGGVERLNMTLLALNLSHRVNGVTRAHERVTDRLFPGHDIHHITNGVHAVTWSSDSFRGLYDRHLPGWREDPAMLRKALSIPAEEVWGAHAAAKASLLRIVRERTGVALNPDALTVGFARRSTAYKRPDLIFQQLDTLRRVGSDKLQLVFSGKAHPADADGKALIQKVLEMGRALGREIPVVWLPDYGLELARILVAGADLWLNTPLRPLEASGTSGMKAALNGIPSLSVLDGWWVEGCIEGITGWAIGSPEDPAQGEEDGSALYRKLEETVIPLFYRERDRWILLMRQVIALNASYYNSHRMVQQYVTNAYLT